MYRGLVHFHSLFSYDSMTTIESIVSFAINNNINFLILTDHDKIEGAKSLQSYVAKKNLDIEVIIAAEYKTNLGDVIAVGINSQIIDMEFELFINEVRKQGGVILFPHPYAGHKEIEKIAAAADMIEVFNSRVTDELNEKAMDLAKRHNKPIYYSSDAHSASELKNSIIEFDKCGNLINSLMRSSIRRKTVIKTLRYQVVFSQLIKSFKKRDLKLLVSYVIYAVRNFPNLKKPIH